MARQPNPNGPGATARFTRQVPANGRKPTTARCTDPVESYTDPLAFLNDSRSKYRFADAGQTVLNGVEAMMISFVPSNPEPPVLRKLGGANCFRIDVQLKGKVWIDPATYGVLQFETELAVPAVFPPARNLNRKTIELRQSNSRMRFREFTFSDPEQTVLLPECSENELVVEANGSARRTTETFSNYKRFVAEVTIK